MYSVYKLTDKNGLVYYGSTDNPTTRLRKHKSTLNACCSRKMDRDSMKMDIMKEDITTKEEALWIERDYFENNECVNELRPIITEEERKIKRREYYDNNKEVIIIQQRGYTEKNKKVLSKYQSVYYEKIKEVKKEWYEKNKEQISKQRKEQYKRKKEIKLMGLEDK